MAQMLQINLNKNLSPLLAIIFWFSSPCALAAEHILAEQFGASVGYLYAGVNTNVKLEATGTGTVGSRLSLTQDLNVDDGHSAAKVDAFWRITPKHRIDFSWYNIEMEGLAALGRSVNIGPLQIPIGVEIDTEMGIETYKMNYTYQFLTGQDYEFGLAIGVQLFDVDLRTNTSVAVNTSLGSASTATSTSDSIILPTPVIGIRGAYAFTDKLMLQAHFDYTNLSIDTWDAELYDLRVALEYNVIEHVGIGVGYIYSNVVLENNENSKRLDVDYRLNAGTVYLKAAF